MIKCFTAILLTALLSILASAAEKNEVFSDPEVNFKAAMDKLLSQHMNKDLTKSELYRAATAGMLSSLNTGSSSEEAWNKLLSPHDLEEMQEDLSGKISGIGAAMKFDESTGYARLIHIIPGTPADKVGLKIDDQILSVEGRKFKGKKFQELVSAIRGQTGKSVDLKILREDKVLAFKIQRETIRWTAVELEKIDENTSLLSIGYFTEDSPKLVEEKLQQIKNQNVTKLIIDLRENRGGGFEQAIKVAGLFLPAGQTIASTRTRDGKTQSFQSQKTILGKNVHVVLLTNKETFCGAELFVAALKENGKVKSVGETTFGKWNIQSVETLPNKFALKYTIEDFFSPHGNSFQNVGIKPDIEISLPKEVDVQEMSKFELAKRMSIDTQLKAAVELIQSI
jgi:carboxyl-terminal processing protease